MCIISVAAGSNPAAQILEWGMTVCEKTGYTNPAGLSRVPHSKKLQIHNLKIKCYSYVFQYNK